MHMSCEFCHHDNPHDYRCPNAEPPKSYDKCQQCYITLRHDYPYVIDSEGNIFCSEDCAIKFHGITETEWEDEDE